MARIATASEQGRNRRITQPRPATQIHRRKPLNMRGFLSQVTRKRGPDGETWVKFPGLKRLAMPATGTRLETRSVDVGRCQSTQRPVATQRSPRTTVVLQAHRLRNRWKHGAKTRRATKRGKRLGTEPAESRQRQKPRAAETASRRSSQPDSADRQAQPIR